MLATAATNDSLVQIREREFGETKGMEENSRQKSADVLFIYIWEGGILRQDIWNLLVWDRILIFKGNCISR
ncbi:hypothetical protein AAHA92_19793 [Salvia divinorum]|uniref:Uncharacterized protein n=1 Tax=Salvia divinorum TaxID=28513 RepID=A0ABD1GF45_SALDI